LTAQCIPTSPGLWRRENYREFLESRRAALATVINDFLDQVVQEGSRAALDVAALIDSGESQHIEFKETARYNTHTKQPDKIIEAVIVRAVAGFFNAEGGTILVGVSDSGAVTGLERDLKTLGQRQTLDGYEQFLRSTLNTSLGKDRCAQVKIEFASVDEDTVAIISVPASGRPVFVRDGKNVTFYARSGNTTQALDSEQAHNYITTHFK
jgi:predicted HTH transcriptional regulator